MTFYISFFICHHPNNFSTEWEAHEVSFWRGTKPHPPHNIYKYIKPFQIHEQARPWICFGSYLALDSSTLHTPVTEGGAGNSTSGSISLHTCKTLTSVPIAPSSVRSRNSWKLPRKQAKRRPKNSNALPNVLYYMYYYFEILCAIHCYPTIAKYNISKSCKIICAGGLAILPHWSQTAWNKQEPPNIPKQRLHAFADLVVHVCEKQQVHDVQIDTVIEQLIRSPHLWSAILQFSQTFAAYRNLSRVSRAIYVNLVHKSTQTQSRWWLKKRIHWKRIRLQLLLSSSLPASETTMPQVQLTLATECDRKLSKVTKTMLYNSIKFFHWLMQSSRCSLTECHQYIHWTSTRTQTTQ